MFFLRYSLVIFRAVQKGKEKRKWKKREKKRKEASKGRKRGKRKKFLVILIFVFILAGILVNTLYSLNLNLVFNLTSICPCEFSLALLTVDARPVQVEFESPDPDRTNLILAMAQFGGGKNPPWSRGGPGAPPQMDMGLMGFGGQPAGPPVFQAAHAPQGAPPGMPPGLAQALGGHTGGPHNPAVTLGAAMAAGQQVSQGGIGIGIGNEHHDHSAQSLVSE